MIEEIVANKIEEIFCTEKRFGISNDEVRERLLDLLMDLTKKQREECINAAETVAHDVITEVIEQCEFDVSRFDVRHLVLQINEAIMEAEVKT